MLALAFSSTIVSAQGMASYGAFLSSLDNASREHLDALVGDVQTTVFVSNGVMTVGGEGSARVLDFSVADYSSVVWNSSLLTQVELVRVRVNNSNELASVLDMTGSSSLSQLRYVVVLSAVEASHAQLGNVLNGTGSSVQLLYEISIPN